VFYFFGLYEQKIRLEGTSEMYAVLKAVLMTAVVFMAASFLYKYDYSRGFIIIFIFSSIVFLNLGRLILRVIRRTMIRRGYGVIRILIIGAGKPGRRLARQIEKYKDFGYRVIGFIDDIVQKEKTDYPIFGKLEMLKRIILEKNIDLVFVSDPMMQSEKILAFMADCEDLNVKFKLVSGLYEILAGNIDISELEGIPAIDIKKRSANLIYRFVKRTIDFVLSLAGLAVFSPFWLIIIVLIKIDSKGKALFTQERVGKDGEMFKMFKFRTMKKDADLYEEAPRSSDDKRITRIGKFLRKTSLDELPQLINVLKGEMSLVGPRPEMLFIVKTYTKWQKKRLEVKPGLTGLWQILGRKDLPLHENIEYDFYYIQNQSLLLDLVIMIKTIWAVISGKGAF
jgi:exopolysaccharide biosynthesis polyprenyl glycosylphosphotransferase